jgi:hypothetical protein
MREKLALAATVGALALAPGTPELDGAAAVAPIVQVVASPGAGRRLVFPGQASEWLRTWTPPRFYADTSPVVRRAA